MRLKMMEEESSSRLQEAAHQMEVHDRLQAAESDAEALRDQLRCLQAEARNAPFARDVIFQA